MNQEIKDEIMKLIPKYNEQDFYDTMAYMIAERTYKKLGY